MCQWFLCGFGVSSTDVPVWWINCSLTWFSYWQTVNNTLTHKHTNNQKRKKCYRGSCCVQLPVFVPTESVEPASCEFLAAWISPVIALHCFLLEMFECHISSYSKAAAEEEVITEHLACLLLIYNSKTNQQWIWRPPRFALGGIFTFIFVPYVRCMLSETLLLGAWGLFDLLMALGGTNQFHFVDNGHQCDRHCPRNMKPRVMLAWWWCCFYTIIYFFLFKMRTPVSKSIVPPGFIQNMQTSHTWQMKFKPEPLMSVWSLGATMFLQSCHCVHLSVSWLMCFNQ